MIKVILEDIVSSGGKPYFVGGCVRDMIIGKESKDTDIEVFGVSYDQLNNILSKYGTTNLVGKSFGILKLITENGEYDFSLPRKDSKNGVGHKGFSVELFSDLTIEEAALRRDFTINSISMDHNGNILDPYNGIKDIKNGVLRPTSEAFFEDPLRIFRGFQFSARFNMVPSHDLASESFKYMKDYETLPKERIWEEWKKWAEKGEFYSTSLKYFDRTVLYKIYPEIGNIIGLEQDELFHPEGSVDLHTGYVLDYMHKICKRNNIKGYDRIVLIFAALCHDIGKATTTKVEWKEKYKRFCITSKGHEKVSAELSYVFLNKIGCPAEIIERVIPIVENHMIHELLSNKAINRLSVRLNKGTIKELCYLIEADQSGRPPLKEGIPDNIKYLINQSIALGCYEGRPLPIVKGGDIVNVGFKEGPIIGKIFKKLYDLQINQRFSTKDQGLHMIQGFLNDI